MGLKQVRLKIINGINYDGDILYSDSFDLEDLLDIRCLQKITENKILDGFILEGSTFEKDKYNPKYELNEFNPILEVLQAIDLNKSFEFKDQIYSKMSYHIIYDSFLEISNDLHDLLLYAQDGIDGIIEYVNEKMENNENIKQYQKII